MRLRRLTRLAPPLLAGILVATACTDTPETTGGLDPNGDRTNTTNLTTDEILLTSGLQTVDSCDALLERIKDEAIERVGPYGFDGYGGFDGPVVFEEGIAVERSGVDAAAESAPADGDASTDFSTADSDDSAGRSAEGGDFSGTNNQEQDVDEADLVKTDGERLIIASGNQLRVIDVTGRTPRLVDTITLPEDTFGGQLFLDGDTALLMTSGWTDRPFVERSTPTDWYPGSPIGRLIEIDLDAGRVGRTFEFEGGYLSAREVDGAIRIVLSAAANRFAFVYPSNEGATESAERANRDLIENSTIDQWIPTYHITEGAGANATTVSEGPLVDCDRVHLPSEFAGFGSLILLTADIGDGLAINDALSVFTDAQTVYASTDRVAVATPRWPIYTAEGEIEDNDTNFTTALHTFDITDANRADYVASGSVRGHLLNQYSLSEYDGYLRVATTEGSPWWGGGGESESSVTVLAEEGNVLREVGHAGGLGRGEQIFAVRFLGDIGYVVTFEQIDPLYVIDLSSPTDPRVLGELKIPGFSSYLHPLDEDHLLGVGTDGDEQGFTSGAVLSLFDVSDLSDPRLTAKFKLKEDLGQGEGDSYTPVSNDAKAFTYWNGVAIVPINWWSYDPQNGSESNGAEMVLVRVDVDGELTELGRVAHPSTRECESGIYFDEPRPQPVEPAVDDAPDAEDAGSEDAEASFVDSRRDSTEPVEPEVLPPGPAPDEYCYTYAPEIRRSVVVDENLYTISDAGVRVNEFDGLREVTWIPFQ